MTHNSSFVRWSDGPYLLHGSLNHLNDLFLTELAWQVSLKHDQLQFLFFYQVGPVALSVQLDTLSPLSHLPGDHIYNGIIVEGIPPSNLFVAYATPQQT